MITSRGFINPLWLLVIPLVIVVAGAVFWMQKSSSQVSLEQVNIGAETSSTTPAQIAEEEAARRNEEYREAQKTDPTIQAIRKYLVASAIDPRDKQGAQEVEIDLLLRGERYVLFRRVTYTTVGGPMPQIFDKQMGKIIGSLPVGGEVNIPEGILVVSSRALCLYAIDQPTCKELVGTRLAGNETYDPYGEAAYPGYPVVLADVQQTPSQFTISVFDKATQPKSVEEMNAGIKAKKIREITIQLQP
jgi:hypothetical protein